MSIRKLLARQEFYPRKAVQRALAHNPPNGTAQPSRADEALMQTLKAALALLDVHVLDHFVVTSTQAVSLAELGLL